MSKTTLEYAMTLIDTESSLILEFGVYSGNSLQTIVNNTKCTVIGFDTFTGLPEDWRDGNGKLVGSCSKGRFTTNGIIPKINGENQPVFFKGVFADTLPLFLREYTERISLIHIDCDLYQSTKDVLNLLHNRIIQDKPLLVFDEWFYNHSLKYRDHEQKAFIEWADLNNVNYKLIYYDDTNPGGGEERQIIQIL